MGVMRIEIVVFDGMDELDAVLPFEVLSNGAMTAAGRERGWEVELVGVREPGIVVGAHGMRVEVTAALGRPDAVVVPGGGWGDRAPVGTHQQAVDGYLPDRLRELAPTTAWTASVCTGTMLLAAAGLTDGRPATTHHAALDELRDSGAVITDARVVDDGDLLTCGGVTSGIDLAMWIVERELGADVAASVARVMEYERGHSVWTRPS